MMNMVHRLFRLQCKCVHSYACMLCENSVSKVKPNLCVCVCVCVCECFCACVHVAWACLGVQVYSRCVCGGNNASA